ncbi:MAG: hypothetical protein ACYC1Y_00375 [Minisyncoccota bacterium]
MKSKLVWLLIGIALVVIIGSSIATNNSNEFQSTYTGASTVAGNGSTNNPSTQQIADKTGLGVDQINSAYPIAERYGLGTTSVQDVVKQASYFYALKTNSNYSGALTQAGVGSYNDTVDIFAHLVKNWNVAPSEVATSSSAIFSAITNSSFTWGQLTSTLIANGQKMSPYVSLKDASIQLTALSTNTSLSNSTITDTFNSIGDSLADPTTNLNKTLGGIGSVRSIVRQSDGIINAFQKISSYIQNNQG